jgi:hypothetical protein
LQRLVFGAAYTTSSAYLCRGQDFYTQKLIQRFSRRIKGIGPNGMDSLFLVINQGKANKMGRIEYLAAAPHVDPMMSSSFWHGLLWLYLLLVENFQFPDFENWDEIFDIPTYPSARNHKQISRNDNRSLSQIWIYLIFRTSLDAIQWE